MRSYDSEVFYSHLYRTFSNYIRHDATLDSMHMYKAVVHSVQTHYNNSTKAQRFLKSLASGLFDQQLLQNNNKRNSKVRITAPLYGQCTRRWPVNSRCKGPVMQKPLPCHDVLMKVHNVINDCHIVCLLGYHTARNSGQIYPPLKRAKSNSFFNIYSI